MIGSSSCRISTSNAAPTFVSSRNSQEAIFPSRNSRHSSCPRARGVRFGVGRAVLFGIGFQPPLSVTDSTAFLSRVWLNPPIAVCADFCEHPHCGGFGSGDRFEEVKLAVIADWISRHYHQAQQPVRLRPDRNRVVFPA